MFLNQLNALLMESANPRDTATVDVPLLIRLLEYAREDAKTDMDLHDVTERIIALSTEGKTLSMEDYDAIVGELNESIINEDLSTFTSLGIPPQIAKRAIEEYNFPHDVKLEEVPKPTAKQFTDGDAYFIAGRTPEKSGFVIRQSYRMVSGGFYKFFKFNEEGKVISGAPESLAKALKGMSGKVYKIKQGWMEPRNTTGGKSADSAKRDVLGPNAALHQIFPYIKQAFGGPVDAKLAEYERKIKSAMVDLMDFPEYDKYGRGPGQSMRGTQSALDYANDMLKQIKALREDGKLTGRPTYEQFLRSIKKYASGWGSHYDNEASILEFLKTPNGRAKYVRAFLKDAEYAYSQVANLQMNMLKNAMNESRVEVGGKGMDTFKKSILRDYPKAQFKPNGNDVLAYVDNGRTEVAVGEFDNGSQRGYKYDKPNVKGTDFEVYEACSKKKMFKRK